MAQVKFYIENRKKKTQEGTTKDKKQIKKDNIVPLILKYSFNGMRLEYYTKIRIDKKNYNIDHLLGTGKPAIKPTEPDYDYKNQQLNIIKGHVHAAELEATAAGMTLTVEYFREYLDTKLKEKPTPKAAEPLTFIQFFEQCIKEMKTGTNTKTGHQLSKAMPIKYTTIKNLLEDFEKFRGVKLQWKDFDEKLYNEIIDYMIKEKKYALNTYGRAVRFIKTILKKGTKAGLIASDKYNDTFNGGTEQIDNAYLTDAELDLLYNHDFSDSPRNEKVRDIFLIGCYTGLRFSDYTHIRPGHINGDKIKMITQKTKKQVIIPLHPRVKSILEKYNYQLPLAISNQKFNDYLGDVCREAKINEQYSKSITKAGQVEVKTGKKHEFITSHSARRTFSSNAFKNGIPPYLIMAITGHRTERQFMEYIKVTDDERAEMFAKEAKW
jgi:integrase